MATSKEVSLEELSKDNFKEYQMFICSSSFEERCLIIPEAVRSNPFKRVLICHFSNNYEIANINLNKLKKGLVNHEVIEFRKDNPIKNLDRIVQSINSFRISSKEKQLNILIDITTFTHEMLMILLYLFNRYFTHPAFNVKYLYNSATDYSLNEEFDSKWLSKGVGQIRSVLGYGGQMLPAKKTVLIIFVGFEDERVKSIIDLFEPNKVLIGHASLEGAINEKLQLRNKSIFERLIKTLKIDVETFEFSCKTPDDATTLLNRFIARHSEEYNIIVASLNNKLSTIGCAFSAMQNPDVQICYATALSYNIHGYSNPGENAYIIDI